MGSEMCIRDRSPATIDGVENEGKNNLKIYNKSSANIKIKEGTVIGYVLNQSDPDTLRKMKKKPCSLADHPEQVHRMVEEEIQRKRNATKETLLSKMLKLMEKLELRKNIEPHLFNFLVKALQGIETDELQSLEKVCNYIKGKIEMLESRMNSTDTVSYTHLTLPTKRIV